jgi:hypothetical protein
MQSNEDSVVDQEVRYQQYSQPVRTSQKPISNNNHQVQIKNGRSPKRTKQPSTTDSLSSESNNSNVNQHRAYKAADPSKTLLLPSHKNAVTPGVGSKSGRHGSSKKISKISHQDSSKLTTDNSCYEEYAEVTASSSVQPQQKHRHYNQNHQQKQQSNFEYVSGDLDQEINSRNSSSSASTSADESKMVKQQLASSERDETALNYNNRKVKLVRMSKDQPFVSESEYGNTLEIFNKTSQPVERSAKISGDTRPKKQGRSATGADLKSDTNSMLSGKIV